ncbi:sugar phosphate isomerase/epimerase family protein [Sphingomonas sp.]
MSLSLHHLTALSLDTSALVALAARNKCDQVCLFAYMPQAVRHRYPMIDAASIGDALGRHRLGVATLEVFPLAADADWPAMAAAIETGASLGARWLTAHVQSRGAGARDALRRVSDIARASGVAVGIECNPYSQALRIADALSLIDAAGTADTELLIDTLHFHRSGDSLESLAAANARVRYVQISDAPAAIADNLRWREAIGKRLPPGSGDIPLAAILSALPRLETVSIEVPDRDCPPDALDAHVAACVAATRALLAAR